MSIHSNLRRIHAGLLLAILVGGVIGDVPRVYATFDNGWARAILINTEAFHRIDGTDSAANPELRFGNTGSGITLNKSLEQFEFDANVEVQGTASGKRLHAQDLLTGSGYAVFRNTTDSATAFQISDADGGNPVFNVDTQNEYVGIGTDVPYSPLYIKSSIVNNEIVTLVDNSDNTFLSLDATLGGAGRISLLDGFSTNIRFVADGPSYITQQDFGLDTVSPSTKLHVVGSGSFTGTNARVGIGTDAADTELEVVGTVSGATIQSFGLSDCDNATTSKLLWDVTTGKFSCGTDQSAGGSATLQGAYDNDVNGGDAKISLTSDDDTIVFRNPPSGGTNSGFVFMVDQDVTGYGSGMLIDSNASTGAILALNGKTEGTLTREAPHILFGYNNLFDTKLYRSASQTLTLVGNLLPADNDTFDLGSESNRWANIFAANSINGSGSLSIEGETRFQSASDSTTFFQINDTDGGTPIFNVDTTNEFVGVSNSAPASKLHIFEDNTSAGSNNGITIEQDGTGDAISQYLLSGVRRWVMGVDNSDSDSFKFASSSDLASDAHLTITTGGDVGIDQIAPEAKLDVAGAISGSSLVINGTGQFSGDLTFTDTSDLLMFQDDSIAEIRANGSFYLDFDNNNNSSTRIFRLTTNNGANPLLYIDDNGLAGFNTASPETALEVVGTASGSSLFGYDINNSKSTTTGSILVSGTTDAPRWAEPTSAMIWYLDGDAATGTSQGATVVLPHGFTVTDVNMRADTAPTGQSLIIDINEGGSTIFSTRPEIDAGSTSEDGNHAISDATLDAGSVITLDVDQIGSGTAGADITIMVVGRRHY